MSEFANLVAVRPAWLGTVYGRGNAVVVMALVASAQELVGQGLVEEQSNDAAGAVGALKQVVGDPASAQAI